jgi:hypothetical protein
VVCLGFYAKRGLKGEGRGPRTNSKGPSTVGGSPGSSDHTLTHPLPHLAAKKQRLREPLINCDYKS